MPSPLDATLRPRRDTLPVIRSKWLLVVLVAAAQLICLLGAVALFGGQLQSGLQRLVREQVLLNNEAAARQFAQLLTQIGLANAARAGAQWEQLQSIVESTRLPNNGYFCVVDVRDGRLVAHPQLRIDPSVADRAMGQLLVTDPRGRAQRLDGDGAWPATRGYLAREQGGELLAVHPLGEHLRLLAHQEEAGIAEAIGRVIDLVRSVGAVAAVATVALTGLLTAVIMQRYETRLTRINHELEDLVRVRSQALLRTRDAVIFGLAKLAESRDDSTGQHLERIRDYVEVLAAAYARRRGALAAERVEMLALSSSLHDIGKVGVPDSILLKPAGLSEEERTIIRKHTTIGGDCLLAIKQRMGDDDFLVTACEIAFSHHERWDGAGYPFGLKGEDIPLSGRLVSLADVYDALTTQRVYKPALPHAEARRYILDNAARQFDPAVVEAFLDCEGEFAAIAARLPESTPAHDLRPGAA